MNTLHVPNSFRPGLSQGHHFSRAGLERPDLPGAGAETRAHPHEPAAPGVIVELSAEARSRLEGGGATGPAPPTDDLPAVYSARSAPPPGSTARADALVAMEDEIGSIETTLSDLLGEDWRTASLSSEDQVTASALEETIATLTAQEESLWSTGGDPDELKAVREALDSARDELETLGRSVDPLAGLDEATRNEAIALVTRQNHLKAVHEGLAADPRAT